MRRLIYIAAFVLAVSLGSASAQMRGMGHSAGAMGSHGFSHGGAAPRIGGAHGPTVRPGFPPRSFGPRFGFNPRSGFNPRFGHSRHVFFRHRFFGVPFQNQFFFAGGWPYYGWWGDPFYGSSSYDNFAQDDDYRRQQQMDADLENLRDEVRTLRDENERARYEERQPPAASERPREIASETPPTVLIFRDGHKVETRNYAIVGQTLWLFDQHRATKVPISDLDVHATINADDERGIDFRLPQK